MAAKVSGEVVEEEPKAPEEEEPVPGEGGDTEEAPEEEPDVASVWQARYEEAQKLIGRQGQELGELRRAFTEQQEAYVPPQQLQGPLDLEGLIGEHGGQAVVNWAIDQNPEAIEETARLWALSGDPEGAVFYADFRAEQARLEHAPQQAPPEPDPALQQLSTERKLTEIFREARTSDPNFASYEPGIGPALQSRETPDEIKAMLLSGNPEHMRAAVGFLKPYAQLEAIKAGNQPATEEEPEPAAQDTPAEQQRREQIRRTAIVTGSQRLKGAEAQPGEGELTSEQRIARFKEMFEQEPSTSIEAGLTINGQPVLPQRPTRQSK